MGLLAFAGTPQSRHPEVWSYWLWLWLQGNHSLKGHTMSQWYTHSVCLEEMFSEDSQFHYVFWLGEFRTFTLPIYPPNNLEVQVRQSRTCCWKINSDKFQMYGNLGQLCSRPANQAGKWPNLQPIRVSYPASRVSCPDMGKLLQQPKTTAISNSWFS